MLKWCRRYQKHQMAVQDNYDWESSSSEQAEYVAGNVSEEKHKVDLTERATANDQDETTAKSATAGSSNASRQNATEKTSNIITANAVFAGNERIYDSVVGNLGLDSNDLCAIDTETVVDASAPLESTEINDVPIHSLIDSETMFEMLLEDLSELIGPAALEKKCAQIITSVLEEMGLDWNDPCTDYTKYILDEATNYAVMEKIINKITESAIRGTTGKERKRLKDNALRELGLAPKNSFAEYDDRMTVDATTAKNDGESKEVPEEKTVTRVNDKPDCSEGMDCGEDEYERPGIAEEMMQD